MRLRAALSSGAACRADGSTAPYGPTTGVDEAPTVTLPGDDEALRAGQQHRSRWRYRGARRRKHLLRTAGRRTAHRHIPPAVGSGWWCSGSRPEATRADWLRGKGGMPSLSDEPYLVAPKPRALMSALHEAKCDEQGAVTRCSQVTGSESIGQKEDTEHGQVGRQRIPSELVKPSADGGLWPRARGCDCVLRRALPDRFVSARLGHERRYRRRLVKRHEGLCGSVTAGGALGLGHTGGWPLITSAANLRAAPLPPDGRRGAPRRIGVCSSLHQQQEAPR